MPISISDAIDSGSEDFYCIVKSPIVPGEEKKIFGFDENQARELALNFLSQILKNISLVDKNGSPIRLTY